ncbi:MAG: bifunctional 4-hydroxy-2-oxoglutarate aldolase/2-dehydro-3-deoxy-phosphogluconate aldolase [Verrucomicrobiota bacterium]
MTKGEIIQRIIDPGLVAIMRSDSPEPLVEAAGALAEGGLSTMEITMNTPGALAVIRRAVSQYGSRIVMGAGTVLDAETCRTAILAGAEFIVTPVVKPEVIRMCNRYGKPVICGAYSPTEALTAHEAGADFIKIFPADQLGPGYIRNILAPLPMLRIIPTGGVTPMTAAGYLEAGCAALAVGARLVSSEILAGRDWGKLTEGAAVYMEAVRKARSGLIQKA